MRGVAYQEMKLTYVLQSVVGSIVQESKAILGRIDGAMRGGESKRVLLLEYRPCFFVDLATRKEQIDHGREMVRLDTIGQ